MNKRIFAFLIVFSIALQSLVACGGDGDAGTTTAQTTTGGENTTDSLYDEKGFIKDKIPDSVDFGGETITFLAYSDSEMQEFDAESANGTNAVNDAIYARNEIVKNYLGVELKYSYTIGNSTNWSSYHSTVETSARAGSGDYDILAANSRTIAQCAASGYATNLLKYSVLDFTAPWWSQTLLETSTIGGNLYYASGDISTNMLYSMYFTFFNTDLISAYGMESPYDLVGKNEWTMDKMFEMCYGLFSDTNQNGTRDKDDFFALTCHYFALDALFYSCGLAVVDYKDGYPTLSVDFQGEKCYDWIVKMVDLFKNRNDAYYEETNKPEIYSSLRGIFGSGNSLFLIDYPSAVEKDLNFYENCNYGIVPCPKWDSAQQQYITGMWYNYTLYTIFAPTQKGNMAATVMECLASQSYRIVTPALFETTMKYQYALDDVGSQMFDLIRNGVMFDFGRTFSDSLAVHAAHTYRKQISAGNTNWISYMSRLAQSEERSLQLIVDMFKKNYR